MPPKESHEEETPPSETAAPAPDKNVVDDESPEGPPQYLYIIRHGDRWDYENPGWSKTSSRPGDPPLSALGHQQARETGLFLQSLLDADGLGTEDLTWLSSPFLRCLQTSNEALNALSMPNASSIPILPEYSVFEWDGHGGTWHASLPPLEERQHYFPRLDVSYQSMFVPPLPEPRHAFRQRCEKAVHSLNARFGFPRKSALVIVTHAAACIGLVQAAANRTWAEIHPAAPCGIYRLTRSHASQSVWSLDSGHLNGHTSHMSDMSGKTVPWNNFGDKQVHRGYTGPLTSPFAPESLRRETDEL
jgi:broad specificity phosphatase PhoE